MPGEDAGEKIAKRRKRPKIRKRGKKPTSRHTLVIKRPVWLMTI